jgi:hypothetical protein
MAYYIIFFFCVETITIRKNYEGLLRCDEASYGR